MRTFKTTDAQKLADLLVMIKPSKLDNLATQLASVASGGASTRTTAAQRRTYLAQVGTNRATILAWLLAHVVNT